MNRDAYCEHCGAKVVEYKHNFNAGMANSLWQIYLVNKPVALTDLELTRSQWTNFQKLRYWGLVEQCIDDISKRSNGLWRITDLGIQFIDDSDCTIAHNVWTFRGETMRFEGDFVYFSDIHEKFYKERPQYAAEARSHHE